MSTVLIALVLFALIALVSGSRRKVAPAIIGLSFVLVLAYFALASMGYSPAALVALFK